MYDYGARMYMADLGRWGVIDPRSQYTHEAYSYVWNNPISFNDPSGMQGELSYPDRDGKFKGETWKDSDGTFKWNGKTWTDVNNGSSIITQVTLTGKAQSNSGPGSLAMAALLVSQADSPVPGPADIVAAGMLIGAGVWWTYNQFAPPSTGYTTIADPSAGYRSMNTEDSSGEDTDVNGQDVPQEQKQDGNNKPKRNERAQLKKDKRLGGRKGGILKKMMTDQQSIPKMLENLLEINTKKGKVEKIEMLEVEKKEIKIENIKKQVYGNSKF